VASLVKKRVGQQKTNMADVHIRLPTAQGFDSTNCTMAHVHIRLPTAQGVDSTNCKNGREI